MPIELRVAKSNLFEREVKKFPWVAYCSEVNCHFVVSARNEEQAAESLGVHKCPYNGSSERIPAKPLLSAMWRELDACMDGIMLVKAKMNSAPQDDRPHMQLKHEHWKSRASGIATCLFILLGGAPGYYVSQEDITREAVRRYKMRVGELAWEPTQGDNYDALRDGPTPRWETVVWEMRQRGVAARAQIDPAPNKSIPQPRQSKKRRVAQVPVTPGSLPTTPMAAMPGMGLPGMTSSRKLPDDVATGVRNALNAGMDVSTIASIFQIHASDVESLKGE